MSYIERFFTTVSDTESCLHLDFNSFLKIVASSELSITSEIEVFEVVDRWLNHNTKERSKYAKSLLITVRLSLLSRGTIKQLYKRSKYFNKDDDCKKLLKKSFIQQEKPSFT